MKKRVYLSVLVLAVGLTTAATVYKSDFFEMAKQIEIFTEAYKRINMNYVDEVNSGELMDAAIQSMFEELDPYTNFWNVQQVQEGRLLNSGNYTGIGANVQSLQDKIIIREVYKGQPADKAGLKAGDELTEIDGNRIADFDDDAGTLLKGTAGSVVNITFKRRGRTQTTSLKRERTKAKLVPFYRLFENNIGYIKLTEFGETAAQEVKTALQDLKTQGAEKMILDLRSNPGGLLSEAINVSNLFLPKGQLIVSTQSAVEKYNQIYLTPDEPVDTEIPLVVLIDAHSASASEIVSGSFQDLDRAVIIGARSFGKGLVQRVTPVKYGAQMKLTISRYYTPSGRSIQALDYRHRNEEGSPVRVQAEDDHPYLTKNGRKVYDAGGIDPDVKLTSSEISRVTQALLDQDVIFNFATDYHYTHQLAAPDDFQFTEADFKDFKNYLRQTGFRYETPTQERLSRILNMPEDTELKAEVRQEFDRLLTRIEEVQRDGIDAHRLQIEQQLTTEILKQYFYEEGFYVYALTHHPEIKRAVEILNNPEAYQDLLKP